MKQQQLTLEDFKFPVRRLDLKLKNPSNNLEIKNTNGYEFIVREDTNEIVSIVKPTYKMVTNEKVIDQLMNEFEKYSIKHEINFAHSFLSNTNMRLHVSFPELKLFDGDSDITLGFYLNNSYNGTKSVSNIWGGIRKICSNGQVFGKILSSFKNKHSNTFSYENLIKQVTNTYESIPVIQNKIEELKNKTVKELVLQNKCITPEDFLKKKFTVKFIKQYHYDLINTDTVMNKTQYELMNDMTEFVSHSLHKKSHEVYQASISNIFKF